MKIVARLIRAGADPNALDKSGVAPLHRAVRNRCAAAVRALIEGGADPRLPNKSGSTPLHLAVQNTGRSDSGSEAAKDEQSRVIASDVDGVRVVSVYVPNGERVGSDKYAYKLRWFEALAAWLEAELAVHPRLIVTGDFNVAPEDRDVHDPAAWAGQVLFSDPERAALGRLMALGFADAFRLFEQPEKSFSWWDYRMGAFRRNMGLRIDHMLLSPELARACKACSIDVAPRKLERPSDHAPVVCELEL